ncbi:hypothetical protein BGZ91_003040 [Linnemannia elongata]|nr:hypothetical protein BGZ91_003040 [Linnemannia elongata]KAG0080754.1 hypothetical protein BGZ90_011402 [Linnemannia elongata]
MPAINAINAAKPIGAEPLLLHPSLSNRHYLRPLQDVDEEEGDIYENEPNKVYWNMLHSGHLTYDQEERRQTNINRSLALNSTTSQMKQDKAVWRQLATKAKARRNLTEDYGVIKSVSRSVGERPEGMYEEQNLIRQELRHR